MAAKKTTKKQLRDAEPTILRNYDPMAMEKRVFDMDHAPMRSWDLYSLEERIHQLEINGGGGGSNLTTLNVTPSTSSQIITPEAPYEGFDEVDVAAVTAAIDANIIAGNIKKDVTILGVTGTYEGGGSGDLVKVGTATTGGNRYDITTINDVGFEPDFVITMPVSGGSIWSYWEKNQSWSTTKSLQVNVTSNTCGELDLGRTTGSSGIQSIDSNGFKFINGNASDVSKTFTYIAVKYS